MLHFQFAPVGFKYPRADDLQQAKQVLRNQRPEEGNQGFRPGHYPYFFRSRAATNRFPSSSVSCGGVPSRVPFAGRSRSRQPRMHEHVTNETGAPDYQSKLPIYPGGVRGITAFSPRRLAYPGYPTNFRVRAWPWARARPPARLTRAPLISLDTLDMKHSNNRKGGSER